MTTIATNPEAPTIGLPAPAAEAPIKEGKISKPSTTAKKSTSAATPLQKQFKNQIISPNRGNAALALSALFRSDPTDGATTEKNSTKADSTAAATSANNGLAPTPSPQDTAEQQKEKQQQSNAGGAQFKSQQKQPPMPYTAHHPGAAYHPYPYASAPYGAAGPVPNPISTGKAPNGAATGTGTGGTNDNRGMTFIMQATQAVSPFKQQYHVTPSPHHQQHSYLPPPHAYGYTGYRQGPGGPSPVPPKRSYPAPVLVGNTTAHKKGKKGGRPVKKQKVQGDQAKVKGGGSKKTSYDRTEKSLSQLAKKFMTSFANKPVAPLTATSSSSTPPDESTLSIDDAADALHVERRRIYDIINILESVQIVTRAKKNTYAWHGPDNLPLFFARLQQESFKTFADEAKTNGVITDDTYIRQNAFPEGEDGERKEKSLGKISTDFLQLFLVGNQAIGLTEVSDRILGTQSKECKKTKKADLANLSDETIEAKKKATKQMKTKIRRLYDVANVLQSLGIVEKVNSGGSYNQSSTRPSFNWTFHIPAKDLPEMLAHHDKALLLGKNPNAPTTQTTQQETTITNSAKKMLANINQSGAVDESFVDRVVLPSSTIPVISRESSAEVTTSASSASEFL